MCAPVTGKVRIAPAQAPKIVHVVGQSKVVHREAAPDPAPLGRVGREHGRLLDDEERLGAEMLAGEGRVLDGDKEGCAPSARSAANSSMRGPSAASTSGTGDSGSGALYCAAAIASR